jgi:hypothetical protein
MSFGATWCQNLAGIGRYADWYPDLGKISGPAG